MTASLSFPGVKREIFKHDKNRCINVNEYYPSKQNPTVTSREADIIQLLNEGFKVQDIADRLSISIYTVKHHKKNLFKKLNESCSILYVNDD